VLACSQNFCNISPSLSCFYSRIIQRPSGTLYGKSLIQFSRISGIIYLILWFSEEFLSHGSTNPQCPRTSGTIQVILISHQPLDPSLLSFSLAHQSSALSLSLLLSTTSILSILITTPISCIFRTVGTSKLVPNLFLPSLR
jgi:hypothetical protein